MKHKILKSQMIIMCVVSAVFLCLLLCNILSLRNAKSYSFDLSILVPGLVDQDGSIEIDSESDTPVHTKRFSLGAGTYQINMEYEADTDYSVFIPLDNDNNTTLYLPAGQGVASGEFTLGWPTDRAYMVLDKTDNGIIRIKSVSLSSNKMICTDGIFRFLILLIFFIISIIVVMRARVFDTGERRVLLFMFLLALIINLPYYIGLYPADSGQWVFQEPFNALTRFGIDTRAHLLRLEGDMYGLLDGQFPVVISPNFLNENGELTFLYPSVFLYPFSLMRIFGASMPFVFRLMCVLINVFTLISIYFSCRQMSAGFVLSSIISAVYLFEPHRLWVMFGQGAACGAGIAYIFAPMAVAGAYMILKNQNRGVYMLAFGVTGIMQSHITSLILILSILIVLLLVFFRELMKDGGTGFRLIGKAVLLSILMNLGVMVPFVYFYFSGVNTSALVWGNWDEVLLGFPDLLTNEMSLFFAVGLVAAIWGAVLFRNVSLEYKLALTLIIYTAVLFVITTTFFPWDFLMDRSSLARSFTDVMQLPERFYTIMAPSLLLAMVLLFRDNSPSKIYGGVCAATMGATILYGSVINIGGFLTSGPLLYDQVIGDMNTKQLFDYLPVRDDLEPEMEISGTASLSDWDSVESLFYHKKGTHIDYSYTAQKDGIYAEFPLLKYAGYKAWNEKEEPLMLDFGAAGRIKADLSGDGSEHEIHICYKVEPVFTVLYTFSILFAFAQIVRIRLNNKWDVHIMNP